jgi:phage terminase large subunit
MTFQVLELKPTERGGFAPRGAAADLWRSKASEVIIAGPAETGKTWGCCQKLDALLWKYPGAQAVMVRKTLQSLYGTVMQTYLKVVGDESPVRPFGGSKPEWFDYPNGSRLYLGGMDKPGKVLSAERDFIYINQAEELHLEDWETLLTRATGRAANAPYSQVMADCNPSYPRHWIRQRASLQFLQSRHEDNPTLYDDDGHLTARGEKTMAILDSLTGVRYLRLRKGIWAAAEGVVYPEWDERVHLVDAFPVPSSWRRIRVIDFGYVNPFVCQWWAFDHDDRMYLYREIYMTGRTVEVHAPHILRLSEDETIDGTVADHDAEDRATLEAHGIYSTPANKAVSPGIQAVQERLKRAGDGRPRLFIMRDARVELDDTLLARHVPTCTAEEFDSYEWAKGADNRPLKEQPNKVNDHGMDALRYAVMAQGTGVAYGPALWN